MPFPTVWFTGLKGCVGIVIGEDEYTGKRQAYIGAANGHNEKVDTEAITACGNSLSVAVLKEIIKQLKVNSRR